MSWPSSSLNFFQSLWCNLTHLPVLSSTTETDLKTSFSLLLPSSYLSKWNTYEFVPFLLCSCQTGLDKAYFLTSCSDNLIAFHCLASHLWVPLTQRFPRLCAVFLLVITNVDDDKLWSNLAQIVSPPRSRTSTFIITEIPSHMPPFLLKLFRKLQISLISLLCAKVSWKCEYLQVV